MIRGAIVYYERTFGNRNIAGEFSLIRSPARCTPHDQLRREAQMIQMELGWVELRKPLQFLPIGDLHYSVWAALAAGLHYAGRENPPEGSIKVTPSSAA